MGREEVWRAVPGWSFYEVSDHGQVRSLDRTVETARNGKPYRIRKRGKVLRQSTGHRGHKSVTLQEGGALKHVFVHVLVLTAFDRAARPGEEACHGDGDPSRNTPDNLRWGTRRDNHEDMTRHGTRVRGSRVGTAKLEEREVAAIRAEAGHGTTHRVLAARYGVSRQAVTALISGGAWGHV